MTSTTRSSVPTLPSWTVMPSPLPVGPSGTIAAFERATRFAGQTSVATSGVTPPAGNALRKPPPDGVTTVKLNDTALASAGMPHCPTIGKDLSFGNPRSEGGPQKLTNPPAGRVSITRHGVTATKGNGRRRR